MFYVQSLETGGTLYWKEWHASVTTNSFGLFNLVVGNGVRQAESTVATFDLIDWSVTPKFLKTEIYYSGSWKDMGTSQLMSVPYAMTSGDLAGTVDKLSVKGTTTALDEALFEVKNKNGQTIFAVYNEGVRVYVDDGAKGPKGGFAVGGFDMTKATQQEYFVVSDDSVRIYIDSNPSTKSIKGGFAVGGYDITKGITGDYLNVSGKNDAEVINGEPRVLWYPSKEAFLAGNVLIESKDSVGLNSWASGYRSKAVGLFSQALGYQAIARGNYSTSIGRNSLAHKTNSFALGNQAMAKGIGSYAFGTNAEALGDLSFAIGSVGVDSSGSTGKTIASGYGAIAIGFGSNALGQGGTTLGVEDTASGFFSTAIGYRSVAEGYGSISLGYGTKARALGSVATGWGCVTKPQGTLWAWGSMANGMSTTASNFAATSFGDRTTASGHTSFATGYSTVASGNLSATFGASTTASGAGAIAMGEGTTAQSYASLVLGRYNTASGTPGVWYFWEPVFVIGNGNSSTETSNAMTVYKSGIADFAGYLNVNRSSAGGALYVNSKEALWYDLDHFSWGFDGLYNYYAKPVLIGGTDNTPSYTLTVQGTTNSTGGYFSVSDERWKTNLKQLKNIIPGILHLNGYRFNWRSEKFSGMNFDSGTQIGLIAQDVEKVFPELVRTDNNGYKAVSYEKLTVVLLEGMKEQQEEIVSQQQQINELKALVDKLLKKK
jgi:hypothetical protein